MKKAHKQKSKKTNISLRRRALIYYQRIMLVFKLLILAVIAVFIFTDVFNPFKEKIRSSFYSTTANYGFILENVIIEGQANIPLKEIIDALGKDKGEPIFTVSIREVKERLEDNIWIKGAIVERRLPKTIYIAVVEREPIAIWQFKQKLYLIDSEGNRISKYSGEGFSELIHVVGQDASIYASSLLEDLNKYPALASKVKSAVRYGQRRWNLNFEQKITVKMPERGFDEAYSYLNSLDKNKKFFDQNYKVLDLRDSNKYYLEKY